ncbi:trypsin delta-like [Eurosta solidaginis]|uniref:trypsin delta-like n=1 Tax=Eurosta solidaginis TaxID=178769 RepID=UPI003530974A
MHLRYHFTLMFVVVSYLFLTYTNSEFRIINGVDWDIADSPYLVAVNYSGKNICVGSLVTLQRVLTAWHCLIEKEVDLFIIIAGVTDVRDLTGQNREVYIIIYPYDFSSETRIMDIAVIVLCESFDKSPTVKTIPLCKTTLPARTEMRVSGWGFTTKKGNPSPTLKSTTLRVTSFDQCAERYRTIGRILTPEMVCAAFPGTDICDGDSGAPGVVDGTLCAVASNSIECNHGYIPTIFTNISDPDVLEYISMAMTCKVFPSQINL